VTKPAFTPGGDTALHEAPAGESKGVFAQYPAATKKYIRNDGRQRDNEYRETMARMFVQMSAKEKELFVLSCPPETRQLAQVLCGVGEGASGGTGFIDFLLVQANEQFSEKYQVVETLSDNFVVYLFGNSAPMFQYQGILLNTWQDDQRVWMTRLYQDILRGTQLARRRKLLRIRYDSVIVSGVMLNLNMQVIAGQEDRVPFSFSFIPTQYVIYTAPVGVPTRLKTPFTPAGGYALNTAKTEDTSRLRIAARAAAPAQATRKRAEQKDKSKFSIKGPEGTPARDKLANKVRAKQTAQQTDLKNVMPGSGLKK
jgi:hypothetical protein